MKPSSRFPFPFVGHGVHADYKCLECYLWLEKAPSPALARKISARIPRPLRSFARWEGPILHFGSDDRLEAYVRASYAPQYRKVPFEQAVEKVDARYGKPSGYEPTPAEWRSFAEDLETFAREVNGLAKLRVFLRPAGEGRGKTTPWHTWSVDAALAMLCAQAPARAAKGKSLRQLTWMFTVLAQEIIERHALTPRDRKSLYAWIDRLLPTADDTIGGELARLALSKPLADARTIARELGAPARSRLLRDGGQRAAELFGAEAVIASAVAGITSAKPKTPAAARAMVREAVERIQEGDTPTALAIARALLKNRALAKALARSDREALEEYRENGIVVDASPSMALYDKATTLQRDGELARAASLLELALEFPQPIHWAYNNLVLNYLNQKKLNDGARIADSRVVRREIGPKLPEIYHNTACIYAAQGRIDDALRDVALAKQYGCSTFARMPADEDLRVLWSEPRFKALFADTKVKAPRAARRRNRA